MDMYEFLQCRKITVVLYISMLHMSILVFVFGFIVCKVDYINLRVRSKYMRNTIKRGSHEKKVKIAIIIMLSLLISYGILVTVDCISLKNSEIGTKPIVTINEEITDRRIAYTGLGYTISYYVNGDTTTSNGITLIEETGYGAEFRLFNKILIWAWAE